jgi:hypothetical protein
VAASVTRDPSKPLMMIGIGYALLVNVGRLDLRRFVPGVIVERRSGGLSRSLPKVCGARRRGRHHRRGVLAGWPIQSNEGTRR